MILIEGYRTKCMSSPHFRNGVSSSVTLIGKLLNSSWRQCRSAVNNSNTKYRNLENSVLRLIDLAIGKERSKLTLILAFKP
jgi:hypothetical protein